MTVVLSALELCVIADYCTMEKHLRVRFYTLKKKIDNFEHFSPCFKIKIKFSFLMNDDSFSDLVFLCSLVNTCCGYLIGL